ncbi:MAG TPA: cytochrome c biogenesis protein CcdA [Longimicrobiales bacterium]|nr:cytochrome c biogenesis protein CcdA [Longimicrobiales bacterium]
MNGVDVALPIAFAAGLLSFLSPCVLPLVPSYLTFVTGMSLEDLEEGVDRRTVFVHATLFVVGFSAIFILLGAGASFLGQFLRYYEVWITRIGGVLIILFGLHLAGILRITPLLRERRMHLADKPMGHLGTVLVGVAFGAGWTPCLTPTLGAILTYGLAQETMWEGVGLLSVYSLGLAVPFLLAALALDRFLRASRGIRRWMGVIEKASGVLLILLGLLLLSGQLTVLNAWLARFTPSWLL